MRELEAKLAVDDDFEIPDLDEPLGQLSAELLAPAARTISDVYYDTVDLRLLRWGCTLRHRRRRGWTVKLPVTSDDASLTRDEINLGGRAGKPPPKALRLVTSFSRGEPLVMIARVTTQRTTHTVRSFEGQTLVEVADDVVSSETADGTAMSFRQVEIELAPQAEPSVLGPILQTLIDAGARPDPDSIKLVLALGRPPMEPDIAIVDLPKRPSARDIIHRAIASSVERLILQLPIARLGQDPEGIHQARVATRRLRSDLRTFKPLLDPDWAADLDPRLRELTDRLGLIRDADVLHQLLQTTLAQHPEVDADGGADVLAVLGQQRQQALVALEAHLDQPETYQLLDDLVAAAIDPPTSAEAEEPAKRQLTNLVNKPWRRLDRAVDKLGNHPSASALHRVRILAKRTRYATEAVAPAFGVKTSRFAKALAALQDTLGNLNDASTANQWLSDTANELSPRATFAAGRLAQALDDTAALSRDEWRHNWRTIEKRLPGWLG